MTDPTADAAKLLPCPSVICPSHHPAWDAGVVAGLRDETPGYRVTCAECDASTGYYNSAAEAVNAWNTRPQSAPPAGEPDWDLLVETAGILADVVEWNSAQKRWCFTRQPLIEFTKSVVRLAARPKVEDAK